MIFKLGFIFHTYRKTNMTMEKQPFEDVSPINNCDSWCSKVIFGMNAKQPSLKPVTTSKVTISTPIGFRTKGIQEGFRMFTVNLVMQAVVQLALETLELSGLESLTKGTIFVEMTGPRLACCWS